MSSEPLPDGNISLADRHSTSGEIPGLMCRNCNDGCVSQKWSWDSDCRASTSKKMSPHTSWVGDESGDERYSYCSSCDDQYLEYGGPCSIVDSETLLRRSRWQALKTYFKRLGSVRRWRGVKTRKKGKGDDDDDAKYSAKAKKKSNLVKRD